MENIRYATEAIALRHRGATSLNIVPAFRDIHHLLEYEYLKLEIFDRRLSTYNLLFHARLGRFDTWSYPQSTDDIDDNKQLFSMFRFHRRLTPRR